MLPSCCPHCAAIRAQFPPGVPGGDSAPLAGRWPYFLKLGMQFTQPATSQPVEFKGFFESSLLKTLYSKSVNISRC
jgi:hypothetical protein